MVRLRGTASGQFLQGLWKARKMLRKEISELGLPGVEIVDAPRGSILHTSRPSQLPYNAQLKKKK